MVAEFPSNVEGREYSVGAVTRDQVRNSSEMDTERPVSRQAEVSPRSQRKVSNVIRNQIGFE
jgi:hypothetical protein